MKKTVIFIHFITVLFISCTVNATTTLAIDFSLPEFAKEEYRKPYVAIWAETKDETKSLLLWHLTKSHNDKWLIDIKRWWRKVGRYRDNSFDGVTSATKGAGDYHVELDVSNLSEFTLFIEVVRQKGGRSIVRQKINLHDTTTQFNIAATKELSAVNIEVKK